MVRRAHWIAVLTFSLAGMAGCQRSKPASADTSPASATTVSDARASQAAPTASPGGVPRSIPLPEIFLVSAGSPRNPPITTGNGLTRDEQELLRATNEARSRQKLPLLRPSSQLAEIARVHAGRMARQRQNAYELENRSLPQDVEASFPDQSYALTIGSATVMDGNQIVDKWLSDAQIREQVQDAEYRETGIGIVRDGATYYYVAILQSPKK